MATTTHTPTNANELNDSIYAAKESMTPEKEDQVYILFYRHGMNPQCQKGFTFNGDLKAAVERAKQHCQRMGYRYIFVRPLVSNLEDDEKYKDAYGAVI